MKFNITAAFKARNLIKKFISSRINDIQNLDATYKNEETFIAPAFLRDGVTTWDEAGVKTELKNIVDKIVNAQKALADLNTAIDVANACNRKIVHDLELQKATLSFTTILVDKATYDPITKERKITTNPTTGAQTMESVEVAQSNLFSMSDIKALIRETDKQVREDEEALSEANAKTTFEMSDEWTNWYNTTILES